MVSIHRFSGYEPDGLPLPQLAEKFIAEGIIFLPLHINICVVFKLFIIIYILNNILICIKYLILGLTGIRTQVARFKVSSANHYTIRPLKKYCISK